ncbi:C1 family peptidase [Candidatus Neomarinimicrobiota bacterium]
MEYKITKRMLESFDRNIGKNRLIKMARNAAVHGEVTDLAMNWEAYSQIDHTFSEIVTGEMKVTDQKSSGRCWGFAGLNLLRILLGRKYNLKQFEFSQNYFMFWDKLEKANYFLQNILKTLDEDWNSRLIMHLLIDPIQDGGQWDMFVNLIEKYGVVPQVAMPESHQSSNSSRMNRMITRKLRECAKILRSEHNSGVSTKELIKQKEKMLEVVYQMLVISLGTPPKTFQWQARNKEKKFIRLDPMNPQEFYKETLGINLRDYLCLINAPMVDKKFNEVYTIDYLGNVVEGEIIKYVNLEIDQLKKFATTSIQNDEPVWFGCDVGKHFHRNLGVMDMELFNFELFYSTEFGLDKGGRLEYGDSMMTHAMLFTGVNLENNKPTKWRVENSWGEKGGKKGYDIMTDSWFNEYLYEIVINKKYLSPEIKKTAKKPPISLPPWDPMGALAF